MIDLHRRLKFVEGKQKELLQKYINYKEFSSQKYQARLLKINKSTLKNWMSERLTLPELVFEKICFDFKRGDFYRRFIVKRLNSNWGRKRGGYIRKLQFGNINEFYRNLRIKKEKIRLNYHKELKKNKKITHRTILNILKEKINIKSLIITYLLTDGSLLLKNGSYRLCFFTKDEELKSFIYDMLLNQSRYLPSLSKDKKKGVYTIRVTDNYLAKKLFKLNKNYKKIPYKNQSLEDYIKMPQPSLNFLKKTNNKTRILCLRLALSTDGYVSVPLNGTPIVGLTCYHPTLCYEWQEIFNLVGIKTQIINRKKSWCGVAGVRFSTKSIQKFWEMGGFIKSVKISKKSKKYKGMEKNELLKIAINKINGAVA